MNGGGWSTTYRHLRVHIFLLEGSFNWPEIFKSRQTMKCYFFIISLLPIYLYGSTFQSSGGNSWSHTLIYKTIHCFLRESLKDEGIIYVLSVVRYLLNRRI